MLGCFTKCGCQARLSQAIDLHKQAERLYRHFDVVKDARQLRVHLTVETEEAIPHFCEREPLKMEERFLIGEISNTVCRKV
jgi:hypothetical protein